MKSSVQSAPHRDGGGCPTSHASGLFQDLAEERAILLRLTDDLENAWRSEDERAGRRALIILHRALASHATIENIVFSGRRSEPREAERVAAAARARRETTHELRREVEELLGRTGGSYGGDFKTAASDLAQRLRAHLRLDETPWPLLSVLPGQEIDRAFARRARERIQALESEVAAYERAIDQYL